MLPMGDAKGAQLVLMVEILAAALSASQFGYEASSFFTGEGDPPHVGQLCWPSIWDPSPRAVSASSREPPTEIDNQPGTRLPGERRYELRAKAAQDGVTLPEALAQQLRDMPGGSDSDHYSNELNVEERAMRSTVYAGAAKWTAVKNKDHQFGLFRLKAGSDDWENLTVGGLPDKCEVRAIVVDPRQTNRVYIGTQVGPYLSKDGGDSWKALPLGSDNAVTWSILLHPDRREGHLCRDPGSGRVPHHQRRLELGGIGCARTGGPLPDGLPLPDGCASTRAIQTKSMSESRSEVWCVASTAAIPSRISAAA